jgi:hypothetical protein
MLVTLDVMMTLHISLVVAFSVTERCALDFVSSWLDVLLVPSWMFC